MLERTLFDQHINAIKMKYQIITQTTATTLTHNAQSPTISSEEERIQMVAQNKYVDEVLPHAPWIVD